MTVPPQISRKVRQLDNDVQAIYEMLARIEATQQRHGNRFDEIAETQSEHGALLAEHGTMLAEHGTMLAEHGEKLDAILELLRGRGSADRGP